jgi:hypothetical protein
MHGTLTGRKSPLEALEYFKAAFPKSQYPDVRLEFKTRLNILGQGEGRIPDVKDDRVRVFNGTWSQKRMLEWLYGLDAYVFPTKGEGFGMPPREALATGLPTMFTNCSGLKDMANGRYDFPIPVNRLEDCPLGGTWAVPDRDFCIETMRWMYNNRESAYDKGYRGGVWYGKKWGREALALQLLQVIESVDPATANGFTGEVRRFAPETPEQHTEFYDRIERAAGKAGTLLDFGFGDGMLCTYMVQKGHKVIVVAESDDIDRVKNIVQDKLPGAPVQIIPFDLSVQNAAYLLERLTESIKCCVSQGFLQLSTDSDIRGCIDLMLMISRRCIFSIPSDNYPGQYPMGGHVHSMENVSDFMRGIPSEYRGYGQDNRYIYVDITRR